MIKKTRILVALLITFSLGQAVAQKSAFNSAFLLVQDDQYSKANNLISSLSGAESDFISGEIAYRKGDMSKAQELFNKAAADVKSPWGLVGLGHLSMQKGDLTSATANFDKAVKVNKKNAPTYEIISRICLSLDKQDTATAMKYLEKGLDVNNKFAPFQIVKGNLSAIKGDFGAAANDYQRALFFDASNAEASRELGVLYTKAKNYRDGLEALKKSISLDADQITVYKNLGDLYYTFGKYADAEENYKIYMERCEKSTEDLARFAFILFFNKKYSESSAVLDELLSKGATASVLYRVKGYVACETDDVKGGLGYMEKFFAAHNPDKILSSDYAYYAKLLKKNGQDSLAAVKYEKAIVLDSTIVENYDALADLYSKRGDHLNAVRIFTKLLTVKNDPANINFSIGKEYYYQGYLLSTQTKSADGSPVLTPDAIESYKKAVEAFLLVQKFSPNYVWGYIWEGRSAAQLDPQAVTSASKEAYEKALNILSQDPQKGAKSKVECLKSIGWYYLANSDRASNGQKEELKKQAVDKYTQVLAIDPTDAQAKAALASLKK